MATDVFEYRESDFIHKTSSWADHGPPQLSKFDCELHKRWNQAMSANVFRYKIDHIVTRVVPGPKSYIAQLNTLRATEKRKAQEIATLSHPFNKDVFNFSWVGPSEVIFNLRKLTQGKEEVCLLGDMGNHDLIGESRPACAYLGNGCSTASPSAGSEAAQSLEGTAAERHLLIVNVSPVEYGHCLLVPQIDSHRPQVLTETSIRVAIETMLLSGHRGMRMGFNSLCAMASVNHLHFHLYYLDHQILVDHFPVTHLTGRYFEFTGHTCSGFALQLHGSTAKEMARLAHQISSFFHESDIAHNVLLARGNVFGEEVNPQLMTVRLFIWPRQKFVGTPYNWSWFDTGDGRICSHSAVSLGHMAEDGILIFYLNHMYTFLYAYLESASETNADDAFNVACIELAGHLAVKVEEGFNELTEADADAILASASLPKEKYESLRNTVIKMGLNEHNSLEASLS